jgi:DnaJ like chaperone protein
MSIWGKLGGVAAGMMVGGPVGAALGALAGHYLIDRVQNDPHLAFTIAMIALCGKMAKADGVVLDSEVETFERIFQVPESERAHVRRFFEYARQDRAGFEVYADKIAKIYAGNTEVLEDVLDGLFEIAKADNVLHPGEEVFLKRVAEIFGFSERAYRRIRATHFGPDPSDPYAVLGVDETADDGDIKQAYLALVRENHPDKLIARGVPEEFVRLATVKLAAINGAYDKIRKERAGSP